MKKNKNKIIISILIFILILICIVIFSQRNNLVSKIENYINKEETEDIIFELYSNSDDILKLKITAKDTEQGINKFIYNLESEKEVTINGYNKTAVAIDYEIKNNGKYTFKFIDGSGNQFEKTLVVNDEYRNSLIDIQVSTEKEVDTTGNVSINYFGNENKTRMYKIGENGQWTEYTGEFIIDSYDVLNKNLQDNTTKTVKIYAKIEDKAKNTVIIGKEIKNIDVDVANIPEIIYTGSDRISVLGKYGVYLNEDVDVTINFDQRTDITNYYSFNNGVTWNEYTGPIQTKETHIIAKSIKNISGLEISKKQNCNDVLRDDIIPAEAYDEDDDTAIRTLNESIRIDDGLKGYSLKMLLNCPQWNHVFVRFYLEDNETIVGEGGYWHTYNEKNYLKLTIPENAKWIKIITAQNGYADDCDLYDINIDTTPEGTVKYMYPYITSDGIKNEEKYKIQYFEELAVEKLYSYDNVTWYDYPEEGITLPYGYTVYAKSIDKNNRDSYVHTYKNELTDIIGDESFDGDEDTQVNCIDQKMNVDPSVWNKKIRIVMYAVPLIRINIRFIDENETILKEYSYANEKIDEEFIIPENTEYIFWKYTDGPGRVGELYEVQLIDN